MNVAAGANIAAVCDSALASRRARTQTATAVCQSGAGFKNARLQAGELHLLNLALPAGIPADVAPEYTAAFVDFCQMLMNSNEFVYRN